MPTASIRGMRIATRHLKGPDFFDVKQFPALTFKSTGVTKTGDTTMSVTGDLTVHGVTKSVTVPMEFTGTGKGMRGNAAPASGPISRSIGTTLE